MRRALFVALSLFAFDASAKPDDLEAQVKKLKTGKDVIELFTKLGVQGAGCAECKKVVATKWLTTNVDSKVLVITTTDEGKPCQKLTNDVIVLENNGKAWRSKEHLRTKVVGASPSIDVTTQPVHDAALKDIVIHADGTCDGDRDQSLHIWGFSNNKIEPLVEATKITSYKIVGPPPGTIDIDKTKLLYDENAVGYDALKPYDVAIKSSTSNDTDATLSMKECAASVGTAFATDCELKGSAKIQVAVKHGKAIGATVSTTPPDPFVVKCMRNKLGEATWKDVPGTTGCTRTFKSG